MGDTQYHLYTLEKEGRIKSRRIGQHRHYYPATIIDEQHELILAFLRQESPRDILIYLMEHPGSTQRNLANFKNVSAPAIKWHMSKLQEATLVMVTREGKVVRYFIKDPHSLTYSLKNYVLSLWNSLSDRFAERFLEISLGKEKMNNRNDTNNK